MNTFQKTNNIMKQALKFQLPALALGVFLCFPVIGMAQEGDSNRGEITSTGNSKEKKEKSESDIKTIFGGDKIEHGGYGGASIYYTEMNDKGVLLVGGRGGWIINHTISLGIGGYGITNSPSYSGIIPDDKVDLQGGYGGLYIELIALPKSPIHVSFPILVGAGGVAYQIDREGPVLDENGDPIPRDPENPNFFQVDDDAFFIVEPGVEVELNVLRNFRVAFGVSYRYLGDLNIRNTPSDALDGIAGGITFKFGKF